MTDRSPSPAGDTTPAGRSQDLYLGVAILIFGGLMLAWIIPAQVNDGGSFGLPPSLAPRSLAWMMILCGAVLTLQNLRSRGDGPTLEWGEIVFLCACLLAVGVMLFLMKVLGDAVDIPNGGFLLAAPLGLAAFTFLHARAPIWAYAFNCIAAPALIFAAFWWGLELPLP